MGAITKEIDDAEKMAAAKEETVLKQRMLDALDSEMLVSWAHAKHLKSSLGDQLTPEISEHIDKKPTLSDHIIRQECIAASIRTKFVEQANQVVLVFEGALKQAETEELNKHGLHLTIENRSKL